MRSSLVQLQWASNITTKAVAITWSMLQKCTSDKGHCSTCYNEIWPISKVSKDPSDVALTHELDTWRMFWGSTFVYQIVFRFETWTIQIPVDHIYRYVILVEVMESSSVMTFLVFFCPSKLLSATTAFPHMVEEQNEKFLKGFSLKLHKHSDYAGSNFNTFFAAGFSNLNTCSKEYILTRWAKSTISHSRNSFILVRSEAHASGIQSTLMVPELPLLNKRVHNTIWKEWIFFYDQLCRQRIKSPSLIKSSLLLED